MCDIFGPKPDRAHLKDRGMPPWLQLMLIQAEVNKMLMQHSRRDDGNLDIAKLNDLMISHAVTMLANVLATNGNADAKSLYALFSDSLEREMRTLEKTVEDARKQADKDPRPGASVTSADPNTGRIVITSSGL